jgi:hypothetical protein
MDGRVFLDIAKELIRGGTEGHWRSTAGRAYYALLQEGKAALERWGFATPRRDQIHTYVRLRFVYATDPELQEVGHALERLVFSRDRADYHLASPGSFADDRQARKAIDDAERNIARLDKLEADPSRRAAAIAGIRSKWP